ncbi:glycosyltransferase [Hymenobacter jejuensis]|uniref:Glycosyltransferase family 4 protein n=1 Tax=Hymenobacter jejuensis TaxID=2502781 RepID=A0A5B8A2H5_9BACT|nr:glycosyltransferase [Hymenobacter jejuensis]QDA61498.1 glycosyltransferase family 4 protein [Hymenobacter jejuensis]
MRSLLFAVTTDLNYDQRMQRICSSLAQQGYRVLLVGRERPKSEKLTAQRYRQHRLRCWFNKGKFFYLEFNLRLFFYLLRQRADAWCAIDLDTALPVWLRARLAKQPFVYDAHELFTEVPEVVARPTVQRVWRAVERFVVPRTALAYTVGPALAEVFRQRYGRAFAVVRNISRLAPGNLPPAPDAAPPQGYILYQGALNVGRGLEVLLDAMSLVDNKLLICGEGDLSEVLRARAAALGLLASGKVEFRGYVLPAALQEITRQATVGIMLLENTGLSYYYSLANKFFDYLHAGIPQVIVDFPEYSLLNQEFDVAEVVSLTPQAVAAALNRLLRDEPARYHQLAENCRRARQELNWQREEQVLLALYESLWAPQPISA